MPTNAKGRVENEDSLDVDIMEDTPSKVETSNTKPPSGPVIKMKRISPSSAHAQLKSHFIDMGFLPTIVDQVIEKNGADDADLLLEELLTYSVLQKSSPEGENSTSKFTTHGNQKFEETNADTLYGTIDKTMSLIDMGFSEDEISHAINNFGPNIPVWELADSIFANRIARKVDEELDPQNNKNILSLHNQIESDHLGSAKKHRKGYHRLEEKETNASSSNASSYDGQEKSKKAKHMAALDKTSSCSNNEQEVVSEQRASWHGKSSSCRELNGLVETRLHEVELPSQRTSNLCRNVHYVPSKPPYFFYGNVVDISQDTWNRLSQFLYGIEPEYVNTQFFSAFIRKEGYIHNLPTEKRFHILPRPPMSIEDALPHTKKWWPSWDTRKHLSCIGTETAGVGRLCNEYQKILMDSHGLLDKEQQMELYHQCKRMNLIWVGPHKLSPIEPDHVECILGYPAQHTLIPGIQPADRFLALKYGFQTDTLGYHLSVLKSMYPDGIRVLSVFSGVGGAEVALHRLGIRLKCVVSVEPSELNRKILMRWWNNTGHAGELVQIEGIEKLTINKIEGIIEQFGGFDIVIGANPGACMHSNPKRDSSEGVKLTQFFEFVRVFQQVRSILGRHS